MLASYSIRTDLALEDKERFESDNVEISGVSVEEKVDQEHEIKITEVKIMTENGAKAMGKPIGTYITMEIGNLDVPDDHYQQIISMELKKILKNVLKMKEKDYNILVVGLGNREVTPDALGPCAVDALNITRHIVKEYGKYAMAQKRAHLVSALAPGVMAQTGMETYEIIKGVVEETKPDFVIVIDALAARNSKRLNKTIQISDAGIHPGSGVGNHRNEISEATLKCPVIAIGVPTVVDAATIVRDTMDNLLANLEPNDRYDIIQELMSPHLNRMFVTPKNIDESIVLIGHTIADAINQVFNYEKEA